MKIDATSTDYLRRVRLRFLEESERECFDHLLETRRCLKSSRIRLGWNNSRFPLLAESKRYPSLTSKILGLALRLLRRQARQPL